MNFRHDDLLDRSQSNLMTILPSRDGNDCTLLSTRRFTCRGLDEANSESSIKQNKRINRITGLKCHRMPDRACLISNCVTGRGRDRIPDSESL